MLSRDAHVGLAVVQLLVGIEWLTSGANKALSGTFPQGLADGLQEGLDNNPNAWYLSFLHQVVLPHSVFFGYLIEGAELAIGVVLVSTALVLFGSLRQVGEPWHRLTVVQLLAAATAGAIGALLCVNFHFWMGDGFLPALGGAHAFDEAIDLDMLIPPLSLLITIAQLKLADELTGSVASKALGARFAAFTSGARTSVVRSESTN